MTERLEHLSKALPEERRDFYKGLDREEYAMWRGDWANWAHPGQIPPLGSWRVWLAMAGRGFGKTRAGAEWVREVALTDPSARIALVAASLAEARAVMVEGQSGLLACCAGDPGRPLYEPSLRRVTFATGAVAMLYSAAEPESLRGPQHSHAWCDEIGKWPTAHGRAEQAWDNMLLGLRLGAGQRIAATTTPRAVPLMHRLLAGKASGQTVVTRGKTQDNAQHLAPGFVEAMKAEFGQSALGRQELDGEMLPEVEGALWSRALLESCRGGESPGTFVRVVIGVDPPASAEGDECGIVVAALGEDGRGHVLADCSLGGASPETWARATARAARVWGADRVVAEANQGGAMVKSVLLAADCALPVKLVHASRGKAARAEPVAALYEAGRVRHAGLFPALEDQLCGLTPGGDYTGPTRSPDRADALVWALTELMLARRKLPKVWRF